MYVYMIFYFEVIICCHQAEALSWVFSRPPHSIEADSADFSFLLYVLCIFIYIKPGQADRSEGILPIFFFRFFIEYIDFGQKMSLTLARVEFFDTHLTRRIEWDGPELGISVQNSKWTYFGSEFPTDADGLPTTLPSGQTPSP